MIHSYCKKCGLYICVKGEFAGGKGACPRCKTSLRIPRTLHDGDDGYVRGLRYRTALALETPDEGAAPIITDTSGASNRYECPRCAERFETLLHGENEPAEASTHTPGCCPRCRYENETPLGVSSFPRALGGKAPAANALAAATNDEPPEEGDIFGEPVAPIEGESLDGFLVAPLADNQTLADSVIAGLPLDPVTADDPGEEKGESVETPAQQEASPETGPVPVPPPRPGRTSLADFVPKADLLPAPAPVKKTPEGDPDGWFYLNGARKIGPLTPADLDTLMQRGEIKPCTMVHRKGMEAWQSVETVPALASIHRPVPPPTPTLSDMDLAPRTKDITRLAFLSIWAFLGSVALVGFLLAARIRFLPLEGGGAGTLGWIFFFAMLAGLLVSVGIPLLQWRAFRQSPVSRRAIWIAGVLGIVLSMVAVFVAPRMVTSEHEEAMALQRKEQTLRANAIFQALQGEDLKVAASMIDWEDLKINDTDVAAVYRALATPAEKQALQAKTLAEIKKLLPYPQEEVPALRIVREDLHATTFETHSRRRRLRQRLTIAKGKLIHLQTAPLSQ